MEHLISLQGQEGPFNNEDTIVVHSIQKFVCLIQGLHSFQGLFRLKLQ